MNLKGSIAKLQNSGSRLYLAMAECFSENGLIQNIWLEMAHDEDQQAASLKSLPGAFWNELKQREEGLPDALRSSVPAIEFEREEEHSLQKCLTKTLEFEEPVTLRIYAPLIRQLRTQWTNKALDFYIMVKAHVARLLRVIQSFSGDPVLVQRVGMLLESFEKEVQIPIALPAPSIKAAKRKTIHARSAKDERKASGRTALDRAKKRPLPLGKRAKTIPRRSNSLVKSIELRRRGARR